MVSPSGMTIHCAPYTERVVWVALHIAALWAIAVAQPLFDLLGDNPEFFVAHRAGAAEVTRRHARPRAARAVPVDGAGLAGRAGWRAGSHDDRGPCRGGTRLPARHAIERSGGCDELASGHPDCDCTRRHGGMRSSPPRCRADVSLGAVHCHPCHPGAVLPETRDRPPVRGRGRLGEQHGDPRITWVARDYPRCPRRARRSAAVVVARCRRPDRPKALPELRGVGRRRRLVSRRDHGARLHPMGCAVDRHGPVSNSIGTAVGCRSPRHAVHAPEPHAPDGSVGTRHRFVPSGALPARSRAVDRRSPSRHRPGSPRDLPPDHPDRRPGEERAGSRRAMGGIRHQR